MRRNKTESIISALLLAIVAVLGVNAGGPLLMWNDAQRIPYRWDVSTPVKIFTDSGPFEVIPASAGTPIPNETADEAVAFAANQWSSVPTTSFRAEVVGDFASIGLPDVSDPATAAQVIGTDNGGGLHVIYDAVNAGTTSSPHGKILKEFFGAPNTVLGIASPEWADETTGTITESWLIVSPQLRWKADTQLQHFAAVFTHEMGHAINLAHSQTNGAIFNFNDARGPMSCSTLPYAADTAPKTHLETMYPFLNVNPATAVGIQMSTIDITDDKVSVSNLYPAPGYMETRGSITGRVLQTNGTDGLTGINVIARNLADPYADAVSAMSGDYVRVPTNDDGSFTINGLTPGASYVIYTDTIVNGGFPTKQPLFMPEGEEFFNGSLESNDGITDDRCSYEPVVANAGSTVQADIVLNSVKGAPKFTPMAPGVTIRAISADGSILGGAITTGGTYRYSDADGHQALNTTPQALFGTMSRDGSYFVSETLNSANKRVASLLQYPGGAWQQLPVPEVMAPVTVAPTTEFLTAAYGVAEDGRAVAGSVSVDTNGPLPGETARVRPFIWTPEAGSVELPVPAGARNARPNGISADGSTVLGWHDTAASANRLAAAWVNGEFISLSTPNLVVREANKSTPDGSIILGQGAGPNSAAWYWTREKGVQVLGRFGEINTASANAVSDDGQVIAGFGGSISPWPGDVSGHRAFLWTPELGFVDFENFLKAQGTSFEGWIVNSANSVTPDGTRFVGSGYSPRGLAGWVIDLQKVNICHAPPGNPKNTHTINVLFRGDMANHLKHGDTIGFCTDAD